MTCRHSATKARLIVGAILAEWKEPDAGNMHAGHVCLHQYRMTVLIQRFDQALCRDKIEPRFDIIIFAVRRQPDFPVVDPQPLVAIRDPVARQTDHALDVVESGIFRVAEHHDFAPARLFHFGDLQIDDRQPYAVGELVHEYEVAHQQRRQHRAGRDLEGLHQERPQQEHHQDHRKKTLRVLDPPRLGASRPAPAAQPVMIEQPHGAGCDQQQEQDEREVHAHHRYLPTCRMARKASWGISTLPTCFMRFLPSFCFSSSFFLRVMSPP